MNFLSLIEAKRDGKVFRPEQIRQLIAGLDKAPDYQLAALLMAIFLRGLNQEETRQLTLAMRDSGAVLRFPPDRRPVVDKHSTGGVGDKVSLPLTPLLAALGFRVPMISGRSLGITGGTLDKLESIPGFNTRLSRRRLMAIVQRIGCVMCGPTEEMVPADRILYALRDVTGTVPSIPLITSSILSKKLAEGLGALVLDVKFGRAAFMPTRAQAAQLARSLETLGNRCGVRTCSILSDMNTPLGRAAGNWLEVKEAVACLEGRGPEDLAALVVECAAHLLVLTKRNANLKSARAHATAVLASDIPRRKWEEMLRAQGADWSAYQEKLSRDCTAPAMRVLTASKSGIVRGCDARIIGEIVRDLGGGRLTRESVIQPEAGIDQLAKPGERVRPGAVLGRVHAATAAQATRALKQLRSAFIIR